MLLADSASLSLSCWNLHTQREYHSTNTSLCLEPILPFLQVHCNYELMALFFYLTLLLPHGYVFQVFLKVHTDLLASS